MCVGVYFVMVCFVEVCVALCCGVAFRVDVLCICVHVSLCWRVAFAFVL